MKRIYVYTFFLTLLLSACSQNTADWYGEDSLGVSKALGDSLKERYPKAQFIVWGKDQNYFVAIFRTEGIFTEAWYTPKPYHWVMSKAEISYKILANTTIIEGVTPESINHIYRVERRYGATLFHLTFDRSERLYTTEGRLVLEKGSSIELRPFELNPRLIEYLRRNYIGFEIISVDEDEQQWTVQMIYGEKNLITVDIPKEV